MHPDLSVIDGFEGMEHNGPVGGKPVDHKVAVVSTDWLAADRVATELMGFDFNKVGYLSFSAKAGLERATSNASRSSARRHLTTSGITGRTTPSNSSTSG